MDIKEKLSEMLTKKQKTPLSYADFFNSTFDEIPYIVENLILKGGINIISGSAGVGKTFISLEFILAIASNRKAFNNFSVEKTNILLVNEEDSQRSLHKRIRLMTKEESLPIYFFVHEGIRLDEEDSIADITREIKDKNIGLLVLDNLTQLHSLDENKADQIKKVIFRLREITNMGTTVVLIHHHRKSGIVPNYSSSNLSDSLRGSTVIYGSADTHIAIEKINDSSGNFLSVSQTKNKEDELYPPFRIEIIKSQDSLSFEYSGKYEKKVTALIRTQEQLIEMFSKEMGVRYSKDQIKGIVQANERNINAALKALCESGIVISKTRKQLNDFEGNANEKLYFMSSGVHETSSEPVEQTSSNGLLPIPF